MLVWTQLKGLSVLMTKFQCEISFKESLVT